MSKKEDVKRSFPYLFAPKGFWIDADENIHDIKKMEEDYLKNCINMVKRLEKNVEMYNRSLSEWDLEKKQNDKLKELTEELKNR